jgi:hypothetical protein
VRRARRVDGVEVDAPIQHHKSNRRRLATRLPKHNAIDATPARRRRGEILISAQVAG